MATIDRRGTIAIGRPLPIRTGQTVTTVVVSASRTVTGAATITRTGGTVVACQPSGQRTVTPIGITHTRTGRIAVGRVPIDRTGATRSGHTLGAGRIVGSPGATIDRSGMVVTGRIAQLRAGGTAIGHKLSGTAERLAAGTYERSGGGAGGLGRPGGLLLALQTHPGVTLGAKVTVATNIPARSGTIAGKHALSADRDRDLSRSGTIVTTNVVVGFRVFTGNRNRNGAIISGPRTTGSAARGRLNLTAGTITSSHRLAGRQEVGVTPIYVRTAACTGRTRLIGTWAIRSAMHERAGATTVTIRVSGRAQFRGAGTRPYVFRSVRTGRPVIAVEDGVVVA